MEKNLTIHPQAGGKEILKKRTKIKITFGDTETAAGAFEIADGMIRILYSPEPFNGTVLTEDGDIRNMRLGERFLQFGHKARQYDPLKEYPACALSSLSLEERTLTLGDCSDLQKSMNIESVCEREFFFQLLFTAALLVPEGDFEGICLYEDPYLPVREETKVLYKDRTMTFWQTRTEIKQGVPSVLLSRKAAWILKEGRFVREDTF